MARVRAAAAALLLPAAAAAGGQLRLDPRPHSAFDVRQQQQQAELLPAGNETSPAPTPAPSPAPTPAPATPAPSPAPTPQPTAPPVDPFDALNALLSEVRIPVPRTAVPDLGNITGGTLGPMHVDAASANTVLSTDQSGQTIIKVTSAKAQFNIELLHEEKKDTVSGNATGSMSLTIDLTLRVAAEDASQPWYPPSTLAVPACSAKGTAIQMTCRGLPASICNLFQFSFNVAAPGLVCTAMTKTLPAKVDPAMAAAAAALRAAAADPKPPTPVEVAEAQAAARWPMPLSDLTHPGGLMSILRLAVDAFFRATAPNGELEPNALIDALWAKVFPNAAPGVLSLSTPVTLFHNGSLNITLLNASLGRFSSIMAADLLRPAGKFTTANSLTVGRQDVTVWLRVDDGATSIDAELLAGLSNVTVDFTLLTAVDKLRTPTASLGGKLGAVVHSGCGLLYPVVELNMTRLALSAKAIELRAPIYLARTPVPNAGGSGGVDALLGNATKLLDLWGPALLRVLPRLSQELVRPVLNVAMEESLRVSDVACVKQEKTVPSGLWALTIILSVSIVLSTAAFWHSCLRWPHGLLRTPAAAQQERRAEGKVLDSDGGSDDTDDEYGTDGDSEEGLDVAKFPAPKVTEVVS